ncbi:MAG: methylated-DNA--[protein]-cysteine S-methyltransferase, partial [Solirubrobacterales bacterium]
MSAATIYATIESPVGELLLLGDGRSITALRFDGDGESDRRKAGLTEDRSAFAAAERQLADYFSGERDSFDLPLDPDGTDFQKRVWLALREIPYGETRSYGEIAAAIGSPTAARAVGGANNRNPIAVIVPCHRVIGSGGKLVGYAGGLERKT